MRRRRPSDHPGAAAAILDRLRGHSGIAERRAVRELVRLGSAAVPGLVWAAAYHHNAFARGVAVRALGAFGKRGRPAVLRALNDRAMPVRLAALIALDQMWTRSAAPYVIGMLRDPSGGIRVNAAAILGRHRVREGSSALVRLLRDGMWYVRQEAAQALGMLRVPAARRGLARALDDPRPAVRRAAAAALERIGRG
jgi:HEAT repeat protein